MFEDSIFLSAPKPTSARSRLAFTAALLLQVTALALMILVPLLLPAKLTAVYAKAAPVNLIKPQSLPVVLRPVTLRSLTTGAPSSASSVASNLQPAPNILETHGSSGLGRPVPGDGSDEPALNPIGSGMGSSAVPVGLGASSGTSGPSVVAAPPPPAHGPLSISSGVLAGLLIAPIRPAYPPIARAAHVQGAVEIQATIDTSGYIIDLKIVSGNPMLRNAALQAVEQARYKPFLLNGRPTEVETRITVNFELGAA